MPLAAGSMSTLDDYAFNLRSGLKQAALANLVDLDAMIQDQGYAWLEAYEEEVMSKPYGAPITQLMKTPSRTATVRKTRTVTTAAKDRTEKVKKINEARLGSPQPTRVGSKASRPMLQSRRFAHTFQARTVLSPLQDARVNSPLQPRMINQQLSPVPSSPHPVKKPARGGRKKAPHKAAPAKKGRGKKAAETVVAPDDQAAVPSPEEDAQSGPSWRTVAADEASTATTRPDATISEKPAQTVEAAPDRPSRSTKGKRKAVVESVPAADPAAEMQERSSGPEESVEAEEQLEAVKSPTKPAKKIKSASTRSKGKAAKPAIATTVEPDVPVESESVSMAEAADRDIEETVPPEEVAEVEETLELPAQTHIIPTVSDEIVVDDAAANAEQESNADPNETEPIAMDLAPLLQAVVTVPEKRHSAEEALALLSGPAAISHSGPSQLQAVTLPAAVLAPAPPQPAVTSGPSAFVPKVRSSWLSKALGGGVDSRKSVAPSIPGPSGLQHQHLPQRQNTIDLAAIRKSLAPNGTLKRKSEHGGVEEGRVETRELERPEKHAKLEVVSGPARPALDRTESREKDVFSAPARQSFLPAKSAFKEDVSAAIPTPAPAVATTTSQSSDISRINAQLEEMTKKAAAKEAARKQAAQAASQNQPWNPDTHARQPSGGFFRNITSLGASLGRSIGVAGSPKSAREEAERLARELEEDREAEQEAQRELARLMGEVETGQATKVSESSVQSSLEIGHKAAIEAPVASERRFSDAPTEDEQEEDEIVAELSLIEEPEEDLKVETTPSRPTVALSSTTPAISPPRRAQPGTRGNLYPAQQVRSPRNQQQTGLRLPTPRKMDLDMEDEDLPELPEPTPRKRDATADTDEVEDEYERGFGGGVIAMMLDKALDQQSKARVQPLPKTSSAQSLNKNVLGNSTASNNPMLDRASVMAGKSLGFKPSVNPVKSVQAAAQAAKLEQAAREARLAQRAELERKKEVQAQQKAQEEARKKEEDKRQREAALEKQKRLRLETEKARAERDLKLKQMQAEREARERAEKEEAARAKAREEEERRRKLAERMAKLSQQNLKKQSSVSINVAPTSTMTKVGPSILKAAGQVDTQQRVPLGQPSRPSVMRPSHQAGPANAHGHPALPMSAVLAQSRLDLQATLQQQALDIQSEDIVLPDIASEYSDSEDDKSPDFKRPTWAESPLLREALAQQASRDPDELFGPIKPVAMEELFKIKTSKYRARTSSANWVIKGDGLTKAEEVEYAKRMGFRQAGNGQGSGSVFQ